MDETPQEGAGGQHHSPCPELTPIREPQPCDALIADDEIIGLGLDHSEPWGVGNAAGWLQHKADGRPGARPAHRRTFAAVENAN
jgi:hypothetical protein